MQKLNVKKFAFITATTITAISFVLQLFTQTLFPISVFSRDIEYFVPTPPTAGRLSRIPSITLTMFNIIIIFIVALLATMLLASIYNKKAES